jgi:hypothetical protein
LDSICAEAWIEAAQHAEDLRTWLMKGGFPPGGGKIRTSSINALLDWLISHAQRDA